MIGKDVAFGANDVSIGTKRISVPFKTATVKELRTLARRAGVTPSIYIRMLVLTALPKARKFADALA